jgi:hypothetical protein
MIYSIKDLEAHLEAIIALLKKHKESEDNYNEEAILHSYEISGWSDLSIEKIFRHELTKSCYWPTIRMVSIRKTELFGRILIDYLESVGAEGCDGQKEVYLI